MSLCLSIFHRLCLSVFLSTFLPFSMCPSSPVSFFAAKWKLVQPEITSLSLSLIYTHFKQVYACVSVWVCACVRACGFFRLLGRWLYHAKGVCKRSKKMFDKLLFCRDSEIFSYVVVLVIVCIDRVSYFSLIPKNMFRYCHAKYIILDNLKYETFRMIIGYDWYVYPLWLYTYDGKWIAYF